MSNLCDLGAGLLAGSRWEDPESFRMSMDGQPVGQMCGISTFAEVTTVAVDSAIKLPEDIPLEKACLVGCGVGTGWGSAVNSAEVRPGDTVIVMGIGGIGINAVQGASHAGASNIIAVDPVAFKREKAQEFGATHAVETMEEATELAQSFTNGQGADSAIITVGVIKGEHLGQAMPPAGHPAPSGRPWLTTLDDPTSGDLDLDATMARLDTSPRLRGSDVRVRDWRRRGSAYVVLVDASGSVAGARLATAVLTAGAVATRMRAGDELAVLAFAADVLVLRPLDSPRPPGDALDSLLDVRGGGVTDLAHALRAGLAEAGRARSPGRELLVLTDGLATSGADPLLVAATAARTGARIHVLALTEDDEARLACAGLAGAGGGRVGRLLRPSHAPSAVEAVLG
ncbi:MAG: zinc-binding dehydrogenase [Nocardioidaceae bacterium]